MSVRIQIVWYDPLVWMWCPTTYLIHPKAN